jgi:hypothetical protein
MSEIDEPVEEMEGEEPSAELDSAEDDDAEPKPRSRNLEMGMPPSEVQT